MGDDLYHGCHDCTWPQTVWSPVFEAWLCYMCLAKRTDIYLDMKIGTSDAMLPTPEEH